MWGGERAVSIFTNELVYSRQNKPKQTNKKKVKTTTTKKTPRMFKTVLKCTFFLINPPRAPFMLLAVSHKTVSALKDLLKRTLLHNHRSKRTLRLCLQQHFILVKELAF